MRPSLVVFAALLGGVTAASAQSTAPFADSITITATATAREDVGGRGYRRRRDGGRDRRPPGGPGGRPPAHRPRPRARAGRLRRQGDLALLARHQLEPHPGAVERHRAQRSLSRRLRLVDALDRRRRAHRGGARPVLGALRLERARWRRPAGDPPRRRGDGSAPRHGRPRGRLERLPARRASPRAGASAPSPSTSPATCDAARARSRTTSTTARRSTSLSTALSASPRPSGALVRWGASDVGIPYDYAGQPTLRARAGVRDDLVRGAVRLDDERLASRRPGGDDRDRSRGERSRRPVRCEPRRRPDATRPAPSCGGASATTSRRPRVSTGTARRSAPGTPSAPASPTSSQRTWAAFGQLSWRPRSAARRRRCAPRRQRRVRRRDQRQGGRRLGDLRGLAVACDLRRGLSRPVARRSLLSRLLEPRPRSPRTRRATSWRSKGGSGGWRTMVALFENDLDNLIEFDFATFVPQNLGRARARGVEGSLALRRGLFDGRLVATWLDAENLDTGGPLLRRPEESASLVVFARPGAWTVGGVVRYVGDRTDFGDVALAAYSTLDLSLARRLGERWEPFVRVENVLDEELRRGGGLSGAGSSDSAPASICGSDRVRSSRPFVAAAALPRSRSWRRPWRSCGRALPRPPRSRRAGGRIAVMAPAAAETLVELGVAGRIVAVGDFVDWPPRARAGCRRSAAHDAPNPERLVELDVTLLFTAASEAGRGEHARLEGLGIRVVALDTSTFAGTLGGDRRDRPAGRARAGGACAARAHRRAASRPSADAPRSAPRRRVLVAVGHDPLFVAGPGSHLDELVTIAGGENIARDARVALSDGRSRDDSRARAGGHRRQRRQSAGSAARLDGRILDAVAVSAGGRPRPGGLRRSLAAARARTAARRDGRAHGPARPPRALRRAAAGGFRRRAVGATNADDRDRPRTPTRTGRRLPPAAFCAWASA